MSVVRDAIVRAVEDTIAFLRERDRFHTYGPFICLGFLTIILAGAYAHVFAGEPCGDDNTHHLAEIARLTQAMREGDWDWWNPGGNSGFPSGYYYQVLPQAVPAAFAAVFDTSPLLGFQLGIFIPLVLAPAAGYRAMRVLGAGSWVALGAAIAIPFTTGGDMMAWGNDSARWGHGADGTFAVGLYTQLWATVAFPLALAHTHRFLDDGRNLAPAVFWGLFVGLSHPICGVALGIAAAVGTGWVFLRWAIRWTAGARAQLEGWPEVARPWWPTIRLTILGALLVVGSACTWLTVAVDYEAFGGFPHRVVDEVGPGFTLMFEYLYKGNLLDYARAPVLTYLLPVVILFARASWLPRMWAAAVVYFVLLGVGRHIGKTGDDDLLPAVRFLPTLQIVLAMAIGGGFVLVAQRVWRSWAQHRLTPGQQTWVAVSVIVPMLMIVVGGVVRQRDRVRVAADFKSVHVDDMKDLMRAIRGAPPGRIQARSGADSHWAVTLPYVYADRPAALVMGGAVLQSSPNYVYQWELRDIRPDLEAYAFDSPLVLFKGSQRDDIEGGELYAEGAIYSILKFPSPGLVSPVHVVDTLPAGRKAARTRTVEWLWSEMVFKDEVLAHAGHGGPGPAPDGYTIDSHRHGGHITAQVMATTPTTFAIRESWHPRWTATLDGAPVTIRRITPDYMAIDVPPGRHALDLRFERPLWAWLLWLLWPGLVIAAWAVERRRLS